MALSNKTKAAIGREDLPVRDDLESALGVHTTIIKAVEFSKAESELLQTNALTVEDNDPFYTLYEITQQSALVKPTYDPWLLQTLTHQNNTLLQCVSSMEINIDGTGWVIEPRDPKALEETIQGEIAGEEQTQLGEEEEEQTGEESREFVPPPESPEELMEQEKRKHEAKEAKRLKAEADAKRKKELEDEQEKIRKGIEDFFDEPWPGMSFTTIRRKLRRDLETVGNAYLEVIRNQQGDIVFLNYLDAKLVRMVRMGKPVEVDTTVSRFGKESTVKTLKRERRYAMLIGAKTTVSNVTKVRYFKEFNASRNLNKHTGLWEGDGTENPAGEKPTQSPTSYNDGQVPEVPVPGITGLVSNFALDSAPGPVPPNEQATEIIHFTMLPDIGTLYGVPRWINNVPSVLGSRKAEELNLEFFNSGGLPPAMILIQGGALSDASRRALTGYLGGEAKHKQRGIIAEVFSSGGDLNTANNVKVTVERFGAERQQDAMFMKYDETCSKHVRQSFRLPPLFVGDSKEHNFATAQASYMVAEAQVFDPERKEFDEIINISLMAELAPEWLFRSMPLSVNDTETQIKALEISKDAADKDCWLGQVNEVAHLELECPDEEDEESDTAMQVAQRMGMMMGAPAAAQNGEEGARPFNQIDVQGDRNGQIAKIDDGILEDLATDWSDWITGEREFSEESVVIMREMIDALAPSIRRVFNNYVSMKTLQGEHHDPEGTADLFDHAAADMAEMEKDDFNVGDLERDGGKLQPEQGKKMKRKKRGKT